MKTKHWLFLSAVLNLALVAGFFGRPTPSPKNAPPASVAPITSAAPAPVPAQPRPTASWVQSLRESGMSEERLGEIAAADFESRWQQRLRDAQRRYNHGELTDNAMALLRLQHDDAEEAELRTTLGPDGFARWDRENMLRAFDRSMLNLSSADTESLYRFCKDLQRRQHDAEQARLEGTMDEGDADRQAAAAQGEYEHQLKTLLGADRYATVQNDNNPEAGKLRRQLLDLDLPSDQVDAVLQAQKTIDDQREKLEESFRSGQVVGSDYDQQAKALDDARAKAFQNVLGADAYAEFQNDQDTRYRTLKQYGSVWGLNDNDVRNLFSTIQDYDKNIQDYQNRARDIEAHGQVVDWDGVQAVLQDYSRQTEQALQKALGKPLVIKLQQHNVLGFDTE